MITSSANPKIKQIRRLIRDRKEREASGLFYAEGLRVIGEAVQMGAPIECLFVAPDLLTSDFGWEVVREHKSRAGLLEEVSADVFREVSSKDGPQGIGAVLRECWEPLDRVKLSPGDLWLALDAIQDPGNLGTCLRTADAVGAKGLILLDHSTDPYDLTALRASTGAVFSQQLVRASLAEFTVWKRRVNAPVVGSSGSAALSYRDLKYPDPVILLMGSEREGLQPEHYAICDQVVSIPMVGRSDSLNLSIAAGVILYEIFHQHQGTESG